MSTKRHSILVIDDDPMALKVLTVQLRAFGLRSFGYPDLMTSESAQAAVALLESGHDSIALILCDLQMPGMDGVQFVRHLAQLKYQGGLVLVSGEDKRILQTAEQLALAHGLRVLGAFQKPIFRDQLLTVLAAALPRAEADPVGDGLPCSADELEHAIESGQLLSFCQPKIDLDSDDVIGVEALVGWRHPEHGLISPDKLMGLARSSNLLDKVADVALKYAVRQAGRWRDAGLPINVAVNISMSHLSSLEFPNELEKMAQDAGIPLNCLTLEIRESEVLADPLLQLDTLARLRLKGVSLSIDEFGIGSPALVLLRNSPFDELKIDRGIVHQSVRDPIFDAILQTSLQVGRGFGMKIVGTGVSDQIDWDGLHSIGCGYAQGDFIEKPMLVDDFKDWLGQWRARSRKTGH